MIEKIKQLKYVSTAEVIEDLELFSVQWFNIIFKDVSKTLVINYINKKEVTLLTPDFSLCYTEKSLVVTSNGVDTVIDQNITEEWFFQKSVVENYSSVSYDDIEFLREVFKLNQENNYA